MLSLSRKTDYALLALAHLAHQQHGRPVCISARALADRYDLPRSLMANLLKQLQHAGIISSTRGASGGYMLLKAPHSITLNDVLQAVEHAGVEVARCCRDSPATGPQSADRVEHEACGECACQIADSCPIRDSIRTLNHQLNAIFGCITLRDLLEGRVGDATTQALQPESPSQCPVGLTVLPERTAVDPKRLG